MTIHRFLIARQFIDEERGTVRCQSKKLVRQIRKVLRLENGNQVDVLDGQGNVYHCVLQNVRSGVAPDVFQAQITGKEKSIEPVGIRLTIAMPLIKTSRFEWALEKLTELGADKIVPIALSRSVIKTQPFSKLARWRKIIEEATEQCERSRVPELMAPLGFSDWLHQNEQAQDNALRLICIERQTAQSLEEVLCNFRNRQTNSFVGVDCIDPWASFLRCRGSTVSTQNRMQSAPTLSCAIAVGAEGGFSEEEIQAALTKNFIPVSLGSHILRSETAAIYALSISTSMLAG